MPTEPARPIQLSLCSDVLKPFCVAEFRPTTNRVVHPRGKDRWPRTQQKRTCGAYDRTWLRHLRFRCGQLRTECSCRVVPCAKPLQGSATTTNKINVNVRPYSRAKRPHASATVTNGWFVWNCSSSAWCKVLVFSIARKNLRTWSTSACKDRWWQRRRQGSVRACRSWWNIADVCWCSCRCVLWQPACWALVWSGFRPYESTGTHVSSSRPLALSKRACWIPIPVCLAVTRNRHIAGVWDIIRPTPVWRYELSTAHSQRIMAETRTDRPEPCSTWHITPTPKAPPTERWVFKDVTCLYREKIQYCMIVVLYQERMAYSTGAHTRALTITH